MSHDAFISQFCQAVNAALAINKPVDETALVGLKQLLAADDYWLFDDLMLALQNALNPTHSVTLAIDQQDYRFRQTRYILQDVFDATAFPRFPLPVATLDKTSPLEEMIVIGRFAQLAGACRYAPDGQLLYFDYDPRVTSEYIAGVLEGEIFEFPDSNQVVGAVAYAAVRPKWRGRRHGETLLATFEETVLAQTQAHGQEVALFLLEAEDRAQTYWYRQGFRHVLGSEYFQPPLLFDPTSGDPISESAQDAVMLKYPHGTTDVIEKSVLIEAVGMLYASWYTPPTLANDQAQQRAQSIVDSYFAKFVESLPAGDEVPLGAPPLAV